MRSILILFGIAALGFAIILKKDAPQTVSPIAPTKRSEHVAKSNKHKWTTSSFDERRVIAHVAVNERER
ncbi:MAG TPA: hypothetical protein VIV62_03235 [Chthoniobacterales bacterium]|jgi:hypothetical protein